MAHIRQLIADKIKADNAGFIVKAFPVPVPENIGKGKVWVSVWLETLVNNPTQASVGEDLRILVCTAKTNSEVAEAALEDARDAVLTSLQSLNYVDWSSANRVAPDETFLGYEIILHADTSNPYKA
jgi:hypothetical protein